MITNKFFHLFAATVAAVFLICAVVTVHAAFIRGNDEPNILIGPDDDNEENPIIQPLESPPPVANQSLNNADVLDGRGGNDVVVGLLGSDVLFGRRGDDIIIGGTEQGTPPNSDIMFGDGGNDINIWAPGDGSDAFIGGAGLDALIFGVIDRDEETNVPILSPASAPHEQTGLPTADVSGQGGFCTVERVDDPEFGFPFLVRFRSLTTGAIIVTIRVRGVEQVFCTSEEGGAIAFANLRDDNPQFVEVSEEEVEQLNSTVAQIIR